MSNIDSTTHALYDECLMAEQLIRPRRLLTTLLRSIPGVIPGRSRVANWMVNRFVSDGPIEIQANGLTFECPSAREPVAFYLIADGSYEKKLCKAIAQQLRSDSVFFDVGANIGAISLQAAKHWCPNGRVYCFEASQAIQGYLERNVVRNELGNITILKNAVAAESGKKQTFYDSPSQKFGMGSFTNRFESDGYEVTTVSLDQVVRDQKIDRVDVIKVDVEGFELGVFQGAHHLLTSAKPPIIFFEFIDWAENNQLYKAGDAQRFLQSIGYKTTTLEDWRVGDRKGKPVIEKGSAELVAFRP